MPRRDTPRLTPRRAAWVKDFAAIRLILAAAKSGQFELEIQGWLAMAASDVDMASSSRPRLPTDPNDPGLAPAATDVRNAADAATTPAVKIAEYQMLREIETARNNDAGHRLRQRRAQQAATQRSGPTGRCCMMQIRQAYSARQYDQVLQLINANKVNFIDATLQQQAFYLQGRRGDGLSGGVAVGR